MHDGEGLDPLGVIARAWRVLVIGAVLGALVVGAVVSLLPASYTSSAKLRISVDTTGNEDPARQVSTQLGLVTSDDVVNQVATTLGTTARYVRTHITATADTTADLITVTAKRGSAAAARQLAQTMSTTFADVSRTKGDIAEKQAQLDAQKQVVDALQKQLTSGGATSSAVLPGLQQAFADASAREQTLQNEVNSFVSPATVVTNADSPTGRSGLGPKTGAALGLLIGLVAAGIVAFVRAGRAATGGAIGRLVAAAGAPVIATLPPLTEPADALDGRPSEAALDGGRAAAAALSHRGNRTVLITGPGDPGQRPLAARLIAEAAAAAGRPTTLVEADLRRAPHGPAPGLAGLLRAHSRTSTDAMRAAAVATDVGNLSELRSGLDPTMALDLLRGPALPPVLAALHLDSELVIVDGPALDSPEVRAVAEAAGDVVVVVTSAAKAEEIGSGVANLRAGGANVLGLIEITGRRRGSSARPRPARGGAAVARPVEERASTAPEIAVRRDVEAEEPPQVKVQPAADDRRPPSFTVVTPDEPPSRAAAAGRAADEEVGPLRAVPSAERDAD